MTTLFEEKGIDYEKICKMSCEAKESYQLGFPVGHDGMGVVLNKFGGEGISGDGLYPVIGVYDDKGFMLSAVIRFAPLSEEDDNSIDDAEVIGYVAVDSGQLLITDPCYILKSKP